MKGLLVLVLIKPFFSWACPPNEIHVREQWINSYTRGDGTFVSGHPRSEHCREIQGENYFQDSSSNEFKSFKGKFKPWSSLEKNTLNNELDKLPPRLKKYKIANFLRSNTHVGNHRNPAITYPDSKTIILFDAFFSSSDKQSILLHEISHIAAWDIDPVELQHFFISNGWIYIPGQSPKPPTTVIIPDSVNSPSEDFSNSIETYYSDPEKLKRFNPKSFSIIEQIIKSMEKK
jgi:hypothetical protein